MAQDPKASIKSIFCNFLENSVFSPVFFALKMAVELKPVAFNVEPYQFELIPTESDWEISDHILYGFKGKRPSWYKEYW